MDEKWIILTEWYWPENEERRTELKQCLQENLNSPWVSKIVLFAEVMDGIDKSILAANKIIFQDAPFRPTFRKLVMYASEKFESDRIAIINNDISFKYFKNFKPDIGTIYCNSRYELVNDSPIWFDDYQNTYGKGRSHSASQDAWLFQSGVKLRGGRFCLGVAGCDNRIAWLFHESGNTIENYGQKIRLIHRHESQVRNRTGKGIPSPYLLIDVNGTKTTCFYKTLPHYQHGRNPLNWHIFRSLTMSFEDFWLTLRFIIRTRRTTTLN